MNLDHFITFQRLAREKSFLESAMSLGVSQPTVTLRIKEMEQQLGKVLVKRIGQRVSLTEAGENFLIYTNRILRVMDTGMEIIQSYQTSEPQEIRLATTSSISSYVLPQFLTHWYEKHPLINIHLTSVETQSVLYMIKDQIADVGIIRGNMFDDTLKTVSLGHDPVCLVVGPKHPLAVNNQAQPISIIQLHKEPIIVYRSNSWEMIRQVFFGRGVLPRIAAELSHVSTVKKFVHSDVGIAFLPYSAITEELKKKELYLVQVIETSSIHLPFKAVFLDPSDAIRTTPIVQFIEELENFVRSLPIG